MELAAGSPARYLYGMGAEISGTVIGDMIGDMILSKSESRECFVPTNVIISLRIRSILFHRAY